MDLPIISLASDDVAWLRRHSPDGPTVWSSNSQECWPAVGRGWSRPPQRQPLAGMPSGLRRCVDLVLRHDPRGKRFLVDIAAGALILADGRRPIACIDTSALEDASLTVTA